jgi:hypothetical protein
MEGRGHEQNSVSQLDPRPPNPPPCAGYRVPKAQPGGAAPLSGLVKFGNCYLSLQKICESI